MRRSTLGLVFLALSIIGGSTVFAGDQCSTPSATPKAKADVGATCGPEKATALHQVARGKITGRFDTAMSGVCRFGCATKIKYKTKDVLAQPGAKTGKLTQCPVSGVVFAVDANRPHVRVAGDEYVTCCDTCAKKLKRAPRHYLKV